MPVKIVAAAAVALLLAVGLLLFTLQDRDEPRQQPGTIELKPMPPAEGEAPKPFFAVPEEKVDLPQDNFLDGKGTPIKLAGFRGKVVVLNFWATWCAPCVKELPSLARLQEKRGADDFIVVAVNSERGGEEHAAAFLADNDITGLEAYVDIKMKLFRALRLQGLPTTILIGPDGREIARHEGEAEWDSDKVLAEIDKALATN